MPLHGRRACFGQIASMRRTPRGVGHARGPATRVTSAPALRSARAMAKPILPLDRLVMPRTGLDGLERGPRRDQHRPACSRSWGKKAMSFQQLQRLQHAAVAVFATGLVAIAHAQHHGAVLRHLRLDCAAWPGWAHISRFMAGAMSNGTRSMRARQAQQAQQLVGAPLPGAR